MSNRWVGVVVRGVSTFAVFNAFTGRAGGASVLALRRLDSFGFGASASSSSFRFEDFVVGSGTRFAVCLGGAGIFLAGAFFVVAFATGVSC
jgi:hypothetical protein